MKLQEYNLREGVELAPAERLALQQANVQVTVNEQQPGTYDLVPSSTVGVVQINGHQFHIEPKVGIRRLLFLLSFTRTADWLQPWLAKVDDGATVLDAMATSFAHATDRALSQGVRHGYRRRRESATTVRGRIDIAAQFRRHYDRLVPLEIDFDDYTIDTDANRILLAAVARIRGLHLRQTSTRRLLSRTLARLEGVTYVPYVAATIPEVSLSRLDSYYALPLTLARLILEGRSVEIGSGQTASRSMLFNMNDLFEEFIVTALREELGLDRYTFPRGAAGHAPALDVDERIGLEPDLSWWEAGRCRFVGDVKYKRVNVAGIKHPDLYQLLAYTKAADLAEGLLVYAKGESPERRHQVVSGGPTLTVTTVDLEQDLPGLRSEIRRLGSLVREQARGVSAAALAASEPSSSV